MKDTQAISAVVIIGVLVPVIYILFVIFLTRRGKEFSGMDRFFGGLSKLHADLHAAVMAQSKTPQK
jgi:hypothetical protein